MTAVTYNHNQFKKGAAFISYTGTGAADNAVLLTATDDIPNYDAFLLMSTAGAVDVFVSLDGTNYSTAALSLTDMGAITNDPVLVTVAGRVYGFRGKFRAIKVLQNGGTATEATLACGNL